MIGPQAHENLFQCTSCHGPIKTHEVQHEGKRYVYSFCSRNFWEMFDSYEDFKAWCIEDAVERQGYYADEVIE